MSKNYFLDWDKQQEKRKRSRKIKRNLIGGAILAGVLLVMIGIVFVVSDSLSSPTINKDSGVSACEKMAENVGQPTKADDGKPMTNDELQVAIMPFESSKHADIKVAGTNIVTTIYKVENAPQNDESLGGAVALLTTLQGQWAQLQTACSNHGVTLPPLPAV